MLTSVVDMLRKAQAGGYAVGAFNTVNLETTRAILEAAQKMKSPVVVQITEKTLDYAGGRAIFNLVRTVADCYMPEVPVAIHLDHGKSFEVVSRAVEIGFTSVMYDGSRHAYPDNLSVTKKVVELCRPKGIPVQAELGNVPYIGETDMQHVDWDKYMTDPDQAGEFVRETGIDVLAVAIGNAHGFFTERPEPDYARLEKIREKTAVPLILHGASDWDGTRVREVLERGIAGYNVDTAIRLAYIGALKQALTEGDETDIRRLMGKARDAVRSAVEQKMLLFGSAGKA